MHRQGASSSVFLAISDPTRREILDLLAQGERSVGEIAERFSVSLPAVSQHLAVLRESRLVHRRSVGRQRLYRVRAAPLREVSRWVREYERFWNRKLDALGAYLDENP
jgi:DNA-binding transcriptional ArsR family regulator